MSPQQNTFNIHDYVEQIGNYEWKTTKDLNCVFYTIPSGFKFNGGSVPRAFWNVVAPGDYLHSFLRHDYMYATKMKSRKEADVELRENLILEGCPVILAKTIYSTVRLFGGNHYV